MVTIMSDTVEYVMQGRIKSGPIVLTKRCFILIFCLAATSAAAAPLVSGENHRSAKTGPSTALAEQTPEAAHRPAGADEGEDAIIRRLRVIIDELKRQGPPPVGCMEG